MLGRLVMPLSRAQQEIVHIGSCRGVQVWHPPGGLGRHQGCQRCGTTSRSVDVQAWGQQGSQPQHRKAHQSQQLGRQGSGSSNVSLARFLALPAEPVPPTSAPRYPPHEFEVQVFYPNRLGMVTACHRRTLLIFVGSGGWAFEQ